MPAELPPSLGRALGLARVDLAPAHRIPDFRDESGIPNTVEIVRIVHRSKPSGHVTTDSRARIGVNISEIHGYAQ